MLVDACSSLVGTRLPRLLNQGVVICIERKQFLVSSLDQPYDALVVTLFRSNYRGMLRLYDDGQCDMEIDDERKNISFIYYENITSENLEKIIDDFIEKFLNASSQC